MAENRKHPRKVVEAPVAFQIGDGPLVEATCHDVSLGGMFIDTPSPPAYGTSVVVHVHLPGLPAETAIASTVRWCKPQGMGVQFGRMGARETHALTLLLTSDGGEG